MRLYTILFVPIILFCSACNNSKEQPVTYMPSSRYLEAYRDESRMKNLRDRIINEGDTTAFNELEIICSISGHDRELLYYALRMAEDFNYPRAYYSVYFTMGTDVIKNESIYKKLPKFYLLRAYELGYQDAVDDVEDMYPKGNIPTSQEYWCEIR